MLSIRLGGRGGGGRTTGAVLACRRREGPRSYASPVGCRGAVEKVEADLIDELALDWPRGLLGDGEFKSETGSRGGEKGDGKKVCLGFGDSMMGCLMLGFLGLEKF